MKSSFVIGLLLVAAIVLPGLTVHAQIVGGWTKVAVTDPGVVDSARMAVKLRQEAIKTAGSDETIVLLKVVQAEQQVVQGMNYNLTLQVKTGETVTKAQVRVWVRLWLKPHERYQLTSWKHIDEQPPKP